MIFCLSIFYCIISLSFSALGTIKETAREEVNDGSLISSRKALTDANEMFSPRKEEVGLAVALEPSALTSIHTGSNLSS